MSDEIAFSRNGPWGVVTLTRAHALNSLTWEMVRLMREQLLAWANDGSVHAVLVRAEGEKAFCAGGDIRWLHDSAKEDPAYASEFFREEYRNNALVYHYPKPYVSLIDGIVMGGGVGISVHGDFRVAGDRTLFAMPETGIGLFPDVGGGHFLPRLHDGLGYYYGLTGARAKAADCVAAGVATHYVPSDKMAELENSLFNTPLGSHAHADIETVLDTYAGDPGHASVNDIRADVRKYFFDNADLAELFARLEAGGDGFARDTLETLSRMSPTSMNLTFAQLKRGLGLDFDENMKMEFRMVRRVMEGHDFFEGVRAQIIDRDRTPKWSPAEISGVIGADIEAYFAVLGEDELSLP